MASDAALKADTTDQEDFVLPYANDLRNVVDIDAIRGARLKLAVDPLGGAAVHYWEPINSIYEFDIEVVNPRVDPTFAFMTVDHALAVVGALMTELDPLRRSRFPPSIGRGVPNADIAVRLSSAVRPG